MFCVRPPPGAQLPARPFRFIASLAPISTTIWFAAPCGCGC